jgi:hypothetical protein
LVFNEMHFQVQGPAWKFAPAVGGRNPNTETKTNFSSAPDCRSLPTGGKNKNKIK